MGLRQQAVKGAVWSAVQSWGSSLLGALSFAILARLLTPQDFGLIGLAAAFVAVAELVLRQGVGQALVQREDLQPQHLDTAFWLSTSLGVTLMLAAVIVAGPLGAAFDEPRVAKVLRWLSVVFVLGGLASTPAAVLRRDFRFRSLALRQVLAVGTGGIVAISFALCGMGVWSLVAQILTMHLTGTIVLWSACRWRPALRISRSHFRDLFSFGAPAVGAEAVTVANMRVPDMLVGYWLGAGLLGFYTAAFQILTLLIRLVSQSLSFVALPTFSRLQQQPSQMQNAYLTAVQMGCLLSFPLFVGLGVLAEELVVVVLGAKWAPSVPVLQVFAIAGITQSLIFFSRPLLLAVGRPGIVFKLSALQALLTVATIGVFARWGVLPAAAAYSGCILLFAPFWLWVTQKVTHVSPVDMMRQILAPAGGCLLMAGAVWFIKEPLLQRAGPTAGLIVTVLSGSLVYGGLILLLAPRLFTKVRELGSLAMQRDVRPIGGAHDGSE